MHKDAETISFEIFYTNTNNKQARTFTDFNINKLVKNNQAQTNQQLSFTGVILQGPVSNSAVEIAAVISKLDLVSLHRRIGLLKIVISKNSVNNNVKMIKSSQGRKGKRTRSQNSKDSELSVIDPRQLQVTEHYMTEEDLPSDASYYHQVTTGIYNDSPEIKSYLLICKNINNSKDEKKRKGRLLWVRPADNKILQVLGQNSLRHGIEIIKLFNQNIKARKELRTSRNEVPISYKTTFDGYIVTYILYYEERTIDGYNSVSKNTWLMRIAKDTNFKHRIEIRLECSYNLIFNNDYEAIFNKNNQLEQAISADVTVVQTKSPNHQDGLTISVLYEKNTVCTYNAQQINNKLAKEWASCIESNTSHQKFHPLHSSRDSQICRCEICETEGKNGDFYRNYIKNWERRDNSKYNKIDLLFLDQHLTANFGSTVNTLKTDSIIQGAQLSQFENTCTSYKSLNIHSMPAVQVYTGLVADRKEILALGFVDGTIMLFTKIQNWKNNQESYLIFGYLQLHKNPDAYNKKISEVYFQNNELLYFTNDQIYGQVKLENLNCQIYKYDYCTTCLNLPDFMKCKWNRNTQTCDKDLALTVKTRQNKTAECANQKLITPLSKYYDTKAQNTKINICLYGQQIEEKMSIKLPGQNPEILCDLKKLDGSDLNCNSYPGSHSILSEVQPLALYTCILKSPLQGKTAKLEVKKDGKTSIIEMIALPEDLKFTIRHANEIPGEGLAESHFSQDFLSSGGIKGDTKLKIYANNPKYHDFVDEIKKIRFVENARVNKRLHEITDKYMDYQIFHQEFFTLNLDHFLKSERQRLESQKTLEGCLQSSTNCRGFSAYLFLPWADKLQKVDHWSFDFVLEPEKSREEDEIVFAMKNIEFTDQLKFKNLPRANRKCTIETPIEKTGYSLEHKRLYDVCQLASKTSNDDKPDAIAKPKLIDDYHFDNIYITFDKDPGANPDKYGSNMDVVFYNDKDIQIERLPYFIFTLDPKIESYSWDKINRKVSITGKCLLSPIFETLAVQKVQEGTSSVPDDLLISDAHSTPENSKNYKILNLVNTDKGKASFENKRNRAKRNLLCKNNAKLVFHDSNDDLQKPNSLDYFSEQTVNFWLPRACDVSTNPNDTQCTLPNQVIEEKTLFDSARIYFNSLNKFIVVILGLLILMMIIVIISFFVIKSKNEPNFENASAKIRGRHYFEQAVPEAKRIIREQIFVNTEDFVGKGEFGKVYKGELLPKEALEEDSGKNNKKNRKRNLAKDGSTDENMKLANRSISSNLDPDINKIVAVKTATSLDLRRYDDIKKFIDEAMFGIKIGKHPNVLNISGIFYPTSVDFKTNHEIFSSPVIVTPFMHNGDLKKYLQTYAKSNKLTIRQMIQYAYDIAKGCNFLHSHKIMHRDIAARNVLIDNRGTLKICDFGLCQQANENNYSLVMQKEQQENMFDEILPIPWLAVEIFNGLPFTDHADIWSYGVTIWEIFTRCRKPYTSLNLGNSSIAGFLSERFRLRQPKFMPNAIYDLCLRTWHPDQSKRPSFQEIVESFAKMLDFSTSFGISHDTLFDYLPENPGENKPLVKIILSDKKKSFMEVLKAEQDDQSKKLPYKNAPYIKRQKQHNTGDNREMQLAIFYTVSDNPHNSYKNHYPLGSISSDGLSANPAHNAKRTPLVQKNESVKNSIRRKNNDRAERTRNINITEGYVSDTNPNMKATTNSNYQEDTSSHHMYNKPMMTDVSLSNFDPNVMISSKFSDETMTSKDGSHTMSPIINSPTSGGEVNSKSSPAMGTSNYNQINHTMVEDLPLIVDSEEEGPTPPERKGRPRQPSLM